jgi:hypothetical protein
MPTIGTKLPIRDVRSTVAIGGKADVQIRPALVELRFRMSENCGQRPVRILSPTSQSSRKLQVAYLAARTRDLSGPDTFQNQAEFVRQFKGHFSRRHLQVRILHAQPASAVSVGCVLVAKILATFSRVSATMCGLLSPISWIFDRNRSISCTSLWSSIFNILILRLETRFEFT